MKKLAYIFVIFIVILSSCHPRIKDNDKLTQKVTVTPEQIKVLEQMEQMYLITLNRINDHTVGFNMGYWKKMNDTQRAEITSCLVWYADLRAPREKKSIVLRDMATDTIIASWDEENGFKGIKYKE